MWYSTKSYKPVEERLILLWGFGQYGIGFYRDGKFRQCMHEDDWDVTFWTSLPAGPSKIRKNYCEYGYHDNISLEEGNYDI